LESELAAVRKGQPVSTSQASSDKTASLENEHAAVKVERQSSASQASDTEICLPDAETSPFCSQISLDNNYNIVEDDLAAVKGGEQINGSQATSAVLSLPEAETSSLCSQYSLDDVDTPNCQDGLTYALSQGSLHLSDCTESEDEQHSNATHEDTEYDGGESDAGSTNSQHEFIQSIAEGDQHVRSGLVETSETQGERALRGPPLGVHRCFIWQQDVRVSKAVVSNEQCNITEFEFDGYDTGYEIEDPLEEFDDLIDSTRFDSAEFDDHLDEQHVAKLLGDPDFDDAHGDSYSECEDSIATDDDDVYDWYDYQNSKSRCWSMGSPQSHCGRKVRFCENDVCIEFFGSSDNEAQSPSRPSHVARPFQQWREDTGGIVIRSGISMSPRSKLVDPSFMSSNARMQNPLMQPKACSQSLSEQSCLTSANLTAQKSHACHAKLHLSASPKIFSDRPIGTPRPQDSRLTRNAAEPFHGVAGTPLKTNHPCVTSNCIQQVVGASNPNEAPGFATGCAWFAPFRQQTHATVSSTLQPQRLCAQANSIWHPSPRV